MSIVIEYGKAVLYCDECGRRETFTSFTDARAYIVEEEWETSNVDNEWANICPECQGR